MSGLEPEDWALEVRVPATKAHRWRALLTDAVAEAMSGLEPQH